MLNIVSSHRSNLEPSIAKELWTFIPWNKSYKCFNNFTFWNLLFPWNPPDSSMKSDRFHEIWQISCEIQRISWNMADFMIWNPPDFTWNLPDFTWNPPDFIMKSAIFHEIRWISHEICQISWNLSDFMLESGGFHEIDPKMSQGPMVLFLGLKSAIFIKICNVHKKTVLFVKTALFKICTFQKSALFETKDHLPRKVTPIFSNMAGALAWFFS